MIKAIYPGSFDPITKGHLDIIKRASKLFDEVVVALMVNPKKNCTFDEATRVKMIELCTSDLANVSVVVDHGLTVDLVKKIHAQVVIRGIRAVVDYEYELQQATANMMLDDSIETLFFVAKPEYSFLSSSVAKEIASNKGDISKFIPSQIKDCVLDKFR